MKTKMYNAKLKATDLTVILFIKHQLDYEPLKTKTLIEIDFQFHINKSTRPCRQCQTTYCSGK